ncbi:hypothetical protein B0H10DRAFT_2016900 [Mycena sp. CBHHK59/15]|nr:hypothetical protein B0H10DRAFT_2016900 [Mycena sp. CBHHK59/15]
MMATSYDNYTYTAAKTSTDFDLHPHTYAANEHMPEDEAFNPTLIPENSKAYDDTSPNKFKDEEEDYQPHVEQGPYRTHADLEDSNASLVRNAADVNRGYQDLEYSDPYDVDRAKPVAEKASPFVKLLGVGDGRSTLQQRIEAKKRGIGRQRYPFVVWILTAAMTAVFIYELVANDKAQGTPVSFHPVVNYMLGPSSTVLINVGARFPPCMKNVTALPPTTLIGCLNNTANPATEICTVEEICGFGGFPDSNPNQWFRCIHHTYLFHAGFVHIILNMLAQITISAQIEREMGSGGFFITYFAAGIFGNVLGANFALVGRPSVGASGAIFGKYCFTYFASEGSQFCLRCPDFPQLALMTIELLIGIAIGFIPFGIDNFAHLGGFLMGLLVGTTFYPVISVTKRHRIIMTAAPCEGCRYLSCFPTKSNSYCKG